MNRTLESETDLENLGGRLFISRVNLPHKTKHHHFSITKQVTLKSKNKLFAANFKPNQWLIPKTDVLHSIKERR